jgi:hypothetical protein
MRLLMDFFAFTGQASGRELIVLHRTGAAPHFVRAARKITAKCREFVTQKISWSNE